MLSEIQSDAFKDHDVPRGAIVFRQGLNTVLGSADGANSIGKSTFLLAIDYAFGGDAYSSREDIRSHVGAHDVRFAHVIGGVVYRFMRSAPNGDAVWKCDENYGLQDAMTITDFRKWLLEAYGLTGRYATFRDLVSCHLRIYGKGSMNETRPLEVNSKEPEKAGIVRTVKLFGEYDTLDAGEERRKKADEAKKIFDSACARGYISSARNKTDWLANEKRIAEIETEMDSLLGVYESGLADVDEIESARAAELKGRITKLKRRRTRLRSRLGLIDSDMELGGSPTKRQLDDLARLFPECDLKAIEEVEAFHKGLATILKDEYKEAKSDIRAQMALIDAEIDELTRKANELGEITSLPVAVIRAYSEQQAEVKRLRGANDAYEKKNELVFELRRRRDEAKETEERVLRHLEEIINGDLTILSDQIAGPDQAAPRLTFNSIGSYDYSILGDAGTGAQARSMLMLDLVFLKRTPLPIVVCDSVSLKQVADEPLMRLLEHCDQTEKQVFIAFDRGETYGNGELPRVLADSVVLSLSKGHELYGESWGRKGSATK